MMKHLKRYGVGMVLLLALVLPHTAAMAAQGSKTVLDNGMTVLITEMPSSPSIAIYMLVKTGSATEGKYLGMGISHFVEHMLFKGTKKRPVGAIAAEVKAMGGEINASTSHDYTIYTLDVPPGKFAQGLDIISDMVMNSVFDSQEVRKEQQVIFGEIRMINDRPERKLSDLVYRTVYLRHPYRHPIIGYVPLFGSITQPDLLEYFQTHYTPNNMVLSIAGKVSAQEILPLIKDTFKDFKPKPYVSRDLPMEPKQNSTRTAEQEYPSALTHLSMAYQGVGITDKDMYALDVLAMTLGQGESSRLYQDVYKKQRLVESISASDATPMDRGFFEIECLLSRNDVAETVAAVKAVIDDIKRKGIAPQELEKAKRQVLSQKIFGQQTASEVAYEAAYNEAALGDFQFDEQYVKEVRKVTNDDIKRVAEKYLTEEHLSVVVLKPSSETHSAGTGQKPVVTEIQKSTLPNGLTVLIKEDHTLPIVSINAVCQAGTRQETEALNGINQLTAQMWTQGTKKRSAEDIAGDMESRGGHLGAFGGRNSLGLQMEVLADDFDFALDLLEDLIKNPSFPDKELGKEKEQMKVALKSRDDQIFASTARELEKELFLKNPFRLDPGGTPETIDRIQTKDIADYFHRFAVPSNMVISIYGDIDGTSVLEKLKQKFAGLTSRRVELPSTQEAPPDQLREKTLRKEKEQAAVLMGFQAPRISDGDRYGMEVISSILGSSLSGRFFVKVRDELGQAYTLGAPYTPGIDTGMLVCYVLTKDEHVAKVREIMSRELRNLAEEDVSDKELADAKASLASTFRMSLDTISALAFTTTLDELYGLGFKRYQDYEQNINRVTKADIKRLARQYLNPDRAAVVITRPVELKR